MLMRFFLFNMMMSNTFLASAIRISQRFLLSIVSYSFYLLGEFEEVLILKGKSDASK